MQHERLEVWRRGAALSIAVYRYFSGCREFGFKDQITRSSLSIPSNIAEGGERISGREKCRFFEIAKGSCAELATQIYIGAEIGLIESTISQNWTRETHELASMLGGLIKHLTRD